MDSASDELDAEALGDSDSMGVAVLSGSDEESSRDVIRASKQLKKKK